MSENIPTAEQSINQMISTIHGIATSHAPVEIGLGVVIAPPPEIQIAWNNILLTKENLYIDSILLKGYGRQCNGNMQMPNARGNTKIPSAKGDIRTNSQPKRGGAGRPSFVSHHHKINNSYKADLKGDYTADVTSDYYADVIFVDWGLQAGDLVSILPINGGQQFIVLGKVFYCGDFESSDFESSSRPTQRLF